jgi:Mn-dependent DtxR family transcriptional regulator
MVLTDETVELSVSEAACLDAIREGLATKTTIAVGALRDLKTVAKALKTLQQARLVRRGRDARWRVTVHGQHCSVKRVPDPKPKRGSRAVGKIVQGSATDRLLVALDRPMRGKDLAALLGVSPQRVHQIVVRLLAYDKVRIGDRAHVLHIVARSDDPSVLLTRDEERVLSALPDDTTTVVTGLAAAVHMPTAQSQVALARLCELRLVENAGLRRGKVLYRLTSAGGEHFQRQNRARRAKPALLVVKSDRVRDVLSYLSDHGEARILDVRDALGIAQVSINALMQYLKRKRLVTKVGDELRAPYELTDEGRDTLDNMIRLAA